MPFAMDGTHERPYHPFLIGMRPLAILGTRAVCFALLTLAACSGGDNAAPPPGAGGSGGGGAGSAGSSGGSGTQVTSPDSSSDVSSTPDTGAGGSASEAGDGGTVNCPSLPEGGVAMTLGGNAGEGGADGGE